MPGHIKIARTGRCVAIRRHYLWYGSSFLTIIEVVFMKDILISGEWYRANTVFKVSTQV